MLSSNRELAPLLLVIPLALLAYHVALAKGRNIDQPRSLAKSVTVASPTFFFQLQFGNAELSTSALG